MNSPAHVLSTHPAPERSSVRRLRLLAGRLLAWGLCALAPVLAAQTAPLEAPPAAAPARVPYLLHLDGAASVSGPGSPTLWRGIELGRPLSGGERFWLSAGARAEFLVGSGSSLRLLGEARLDVSRLDDRTLQMALTDGRVLLRVRNLWRGERVEIDMPNFAAVIDQAGDYRFEVDAGRGVSRVGVAHGGVTLWGEGGERAELNTGQQFASGGRRLTPASGQELGRGDALDRYAYERDQANIVASRGYSAIDPSSSSVYVPQPVAPVVVPPVLVPAAPVLVPPGPVYLPPAPVYLPPPPPPVVHVHPRPIYVPAPVFPAHPPHPGWHRPPHPGWHPPGGHDSGQHPPGPGFGHGGPRPPAPQVPVPLQGSAPPVPGVQSAPPPPVRQMRPGGPGGEVGRPFSRRHEPHRFYGT